MAEFPVGFGRYQLVERLALGGMAELFVATAPGEHGFQKRVVIKRLLPQLVHDATYNAMFIDEAKLTARLVHTKIAQTLELGKVDDALYIAMEYIEGIDVLALLREYASKRRRVPPQIAAWIVHEVLDALDYAHNLVGDDGAMLGVVHRDISPSNVLLSLRGDIKLVDFGIARAVDPDRAHKSKSGTLKGKYGYMSPEQVTEQHLDARSDLFSLGVVFAELLTGRRLFAAPNDLDVLLMVRDAKLHRLDKYGSDIDPGLDAIVRKALKKSPEERWQSAVQFRDALAEWLYENRHRITTKQIAEIVVDLFDVVNARRRERTTRPPEPMEAELVISRPPTENPDGAPVMIEDAPSMPVISVSYEPPVEPPKRPPTAKPEPMVVSTETRGVVGRSPTGDQQGVVEIPIGDTISAAVEAITLPDEAGTSDAGLSLPDADPNITLADGSNADQTEDSAMRAFDDLTEPPQPIKARPPTAEEALRQKPPTPPPLPEIEEAPDDAGEFDDTSPLRVLFRLMTARATGLLGVAVGGIKKEIYVRDGQPEYVSSNVASELFGNYLVKKGVLSDGELAMALAMMPHYGGKLGDTLVGLGLLKPLEVFRHLTRQVRAKIIDVCTWSHGRFGWYAGRENPREAFPLDFNAFEILGAGAMSLSDDSIDAWIGKHASERLRAVRSRRVGPERFEVKGLVNLCEQLDGRHSVTELVEQAPDRAERLRIGRMLCLLEACDLARPA